MTDHANERATTQRMIAKIHEIGPLLRGNAAQADRDRRVPQSSIDALEATGVFAINSPRRFGGFEGGARMLLERHAAAVEGFDLPEAFRDIDTPEDYEAWQTGNNDTGAGNLG